MGNASGQRLSRTGPWPLIRRELRAEARHRSNYVIRLLGATGLVVFTAALLADNNTVSSWLSLRLFTGAHALLLLGIWWIGPVLTSDAIARERRQGTLGLLFSTNLTASSVVLGKGVVHMVRLFSLWLASLPVLMVPILLGGITVLDVFTALILEASVAFWALGAGLAVSSMVRQPTLALLAAEVLAGLLFLFLVFLVGLACALQLDAYLTPSVPPLEWASLIHRGMNVITGLFADIGWSGWLRPAGFWGKAAWISILAEVLLLSLLGFTVLTGFATARARHAWMDQPLSRRQQRWREFWLTPRFYVARFLQSRRRRLDRNPLGWLHRHSTWSRAGTLGCGALVLFAESWLASRKQPWLYYDRTQLWLGIFVSLQMTCTAVMMFRTERESGVLELLLVAPMTVQQVIYRQLCGFWRRFYIPIVLMLVLSRLMIWLDWTTPTAFQSFSFVLVNFLTIPVIGLYASAQFQRFVPGFLFAAFFSLGLPLFTPELSPGLLERLAGFEVWILSPFPIPPTDSALLDWLVRLIQIGSALWAGHALAQHLSARTFITVRPGV